MSIVDSTASDKAADRLEVTGMRIGPAFEALGLGWDLAEVMDYLTPGATAIDLPAEEFGRLVGVCVAFAIVCVERDREQRGPVEEEARRLRTQVAAIHQFTAPEVEP